MGVRIDNRWTPIMSLANPSQPSHAGEPAVLAAQHAEPGAPSTPQDRHQDATADLMSRMVQGAHEAIDHLAERATPPLEQLAQGLAQAGDDLHGKAEQWRATGDEWADGLRGSVREHPLAAVAAALAVGVLIARLVR
jgi:ElaB/YqjD/DUF883 family membrane-anchored ribosome-binding protein